jgi:murein DD-endopeptidase MepM/ murein hydrolase activator NlpD
MGNDIFAPEGSPIVAPVDGVVGQVGFNRLGGNSLHIIGPDGSDYYFAHLKGYASWLRPGMRVSAGTVVGAVGHTGGSGDFEPHLHFAVVRSGVAMNPFPRLVRTELATA